MNEIIINEDNWQAFVNPVVDGEQRMMGLIPRDYEQYPVGYCAAAKPFDLPLIPESEWEERLQARIAAKAQLSDVRNRGMGGQPMPSRDQNGKGYCWAHSSTSAVLICRAMEGQPYADLSAFAVACIIKGFRDQGGWGSQSLEFIAERGIPTSEYWPQQSMKRENDNPKTWENAKLHRVTEWMDMEPNNKAQLVTCLLSGIPVVSDFNWWGHSVCTLDLVSINPFRTRIWNSWGDKWSENGTGILEGKKAVPNGMIAPRVMTASKV